MSDSIRDTKSIHNIHRVIDKTNKVGSFEFNVNCLDDDIMNFNTLSKILPIVISEDYNRVLPKNFWDNNFRYCNFSFKKDNNLFEDEIANHRDNYSKNIDNLKNTLLQIIKPYTFFNNHDKDPEIQKVETIKINNYLVTKQRGIGSANDLDRHYPVSVDLEYIDFLSVKNYITKFNLVEVAKTDIRNILILLSELSSESAYLVSENNSYKKFLSDLIFKMYANVSKVYPKSILNYSVFQFCINKYPYETKSGRLYSISNINSNLKNKFEVLDIYYKNIDAILSFINDLEFIEKTDDNKKQYEVNVLKNAYGLCAALVAFVGEEATYQLVTSNVLDGSMINKLSSLRSTFNKLYEVHE